MYSEEEQHKAEKALKIDLDTLMSTWAKKVLYRSSEAPLIYNLVSLDDLTCFIYKDNRKKIYKLMATGYEAEHDFMPISYGKLFDCLETDTNYTAIRQKMRRLINAAANGRTLEKNGLREHYSDKTKRRMVQLQLWEVPELHSKG